MGFFNFFKKNKELDKSNDIHEADAGDLEEFVKTIEKDKLSEFYRNINKEIEKVREVISRILQLNNELNQTIVEDQAAEHIEVRVESAKINFCSRNKRALISFLARELNIESPEDVLNYHQALILLINELNSTGAHYGGAVNVLYKNQMAATSKEIKRLIELSAAVKDEIENHDSLHNIMELLSKSRKLKDLLLFRKKIKDEKFKLVSELDEAENAFYDQKKKKESLENSESYLKAREKQAEIAKLTEEMNYMKILLRNKFSDFSKALALYQTKFAKPDEHPLITSYLREPFEAFDVDNKILIKSILEELKRTLEFKRLDLEERVTNKSALSVTNLLDSKEIETYYERKLNILKAIIDMEKEIKESGVYELNLVKVQIDKFQHQIKNLDTMVEVQTDLIKKNTDGIKKLTKECEHSFTQIGQKVKILIEDSEDT